MICSCVQVVQVFADVILTHKFHLGQLVYTPILVMLELPGFHLVFFILGWGLGIQGQLVWKLASLIFLQCTMSYMYYVVSQ